jgi:hypothetical protein
MEESNDQLLIELKKEARRQEIINIIEVFYTKYTDAKIPNPLDLICLIILNEARITPDLWEYIGDDLIDMCKSPKNILSSINVALSQYNTKKGTYTIHTATELIINCLKLNKKIINN